MVLAKCEDFNYVVQIKLVPLNHKIHVKRVFKSTLPASHKTKYAPVTKTDLLMHCRDNNHSTL
jgi:hypothetical protein